MSWKTTLFGLLGIAGGFIGGAQTLMQNHQAVTAGNLAPLVGPTILLGLGHIFAKDRNVTGGNEFNGLSTPADPRTAAVPVAGSTAAAAGGGQ